MPQRLGPSLHRDPRACLRPLRVTSASLSMERIRDKERNQKTKKNGGSGKDQGTRDQENKGPRKWKEGTGRISASLFCWVPVRVMGTEGGTGRPGGGHRCWIAPARFP